MKGRTTSVLLKEKRLRIDWQGSLNHPVGASQTLRLINWHPRRRLSRILGNAGVGRVRKKARLL